MSKKTSMKININYVIDELDVLPDDEFDMLKEAVDNEEKIRNNRKITIYS